MQEIDMRWVHTPNGADTAPTHLNVVTVVLCALYGTLMAFMRVLRGFWRAFRIGKADGRRGSTLARTLRESTHTGAGAGALGGTLAGTEAQHKIVADGHETYVKSFERDD